MSKRDKTKNEARRLPTYVDHQRFRLRTMFALTRKSDSFRWNEADCRAGTSVTSFRYSLHETETSANLSSSPTAPISLSTRTKHFVPLSLPASSSNSPSDLLTDAFPSESVYREHDTVTRFLSQNEYRILSNRRLFFHIPRIMLYRSHRLSLRLGFIDRNRSQKKREYVGNASNFHRSNANDWVHTEEAFKDSSQTVPSIEGEA